MGAYFRGAVGTISHLTVGQHLEKRRDGVGDAYRDLAAALDEAEKAVESARKACARSAGLAGG